MKFHLQVAIGLAYLVHLCSPRGHFEILVDLFENSECSFTYHHYQTNPEADDTELQIIRENFAGRLLTFRVSTDAILECKNATVPSTYQKRLAHCMVTLVQSGAAHTHLSIERIREDIQSLFIWVFTKSKGEGPSPSKSETGFEFPPLMEFIPSVVFAIVDFRQVIITCATCTASVEYNLESVPPTIEDIRRDYRAINGNSRGGLVLFDHALGKLLHECNSFHNFAPEDCSAPLISHRLNFTFIQEPTGNSTQQQGALYCRRLVSSFDIHFSETGNRRWLHSGILEYDREFIIINRDPGSLQVGMQVGGIMKPMPKRVWLLIGLSGLAVSIIFSLSGTMITSKTITWKNAATAVIKIWVALSLPLLDQPGYGIFKRLKGRRITTMMLVLLWGLWNLAMVTISQAYRSGLFSSLTLGKQPTTADTLEALVESGMMIGTTSTCYLNNTKISCLKDFLLAEAQTVLIRALREQVTYFHASNLSHFVLSTTINKTVRAEIGGIAEIPVPSIFAMIDSAESVDIYANNFPIGGFRTFKKIPIQGYKIHSFWMVHGNYLFPMIGHILKTIDESGLAHRWDRNEREVEKATAEYEVYSKLMENSISDQSLLSDYKSRLHMKYLYGGMSRYDRGHLESGGFSRISKSAYVVIFIYWSWCIGVAVLIFGLEVTIMTMKITRLRAKQAFGNVTL